MAKKLSKILWHDTKVDGAGKPVLPSVATDDKGLNGLLPGELFMHVGKEKVSLWALSLSGEVVEVSGKTDEVDIDFSDYLLKSVWDSVFEIKTDVSGQKYIFGKLPVVTKYGITMYADDGSVKIPQLAEGLPYDQRTIWFNPETKQIEVIGGTGGGVADSVLWDNVEGKPSWITSTKPTYSYSEIQGTPDLSGYATTSSLNAVSTKLNDFLEGSDTDTVINKWKELETFLSGLTESDNLATILTGKADKSYVDANFVTIAGTEDVTGLHNFVNGLKIGGLPITKKQDDVVYLDANLVVRGGITMYAENEEDIPSILDSLPIASNTALGIASFDSTYFSVDSNGMVSLTSAPSSGASSFGELLNVDDSIDATASVDRVLYQPAGSATWTWKELTSSGVVGDYLPLSGGSLSGMLTVATELTGITINNTKTGRTPHITFQAKGTEVGALGISPSNVPQMYNAAKGTWHTILTDDNYSSYALPLSGGTLKAPSNISDILTLTRSHNTGAVSILFKNNSGTLGALGVGGSGSPVPNAPFWFDPSDSTSHPILHGRNYSSYALPLSGGTITGNLQINGNVGIGTTSPSKKLHVVGDIYASKIVEAHDIWACVYHAGGSVAYSANTTGYFRFGTFDEADGGMKMQFGGTGTTGTLQVIDQAWKKILFKLDKSGNVVVAGGITMYSDKRMKTKLQDVELSLSQIANAPLIEHYYNSDQNKTTHVGSIAQYWAGLNDWFCKLDNEGYYTMEIQNAALASAISIARHLEKYESKTDKKIRMLKKRVKELEGKLERLEGGNYGCN